MAIWDKLKQAEETAPIQPVSEDRPHMESNPPEKKRKYHRKKPSMIGKLREIAKECQGIENGKTIEAITHRVLPESAAMSRWHLEVAKNRVRNAIGRLRKRKDLNGFTLYPLYSVPLSWRGKRTQFYFCPKTPEGWKRVKDQAVLHIIPLGRIIMESQILAKEHAETNEEKELAEEMQETILVGQGKKIRHVDELAVEQKGKKKKGDDK